MINTCVKFNTPEGRDLYIELYERLTEELPRKDPEFFQKPLNERMKYYEDSGLIADKFDGKVISDKIMRDLDDETPVASITWEL